MTIRCDLRDTIRNDNFILDSRSIVKKIREYQFSLKSASDQRSHKGEHIIEQDKLERKIQLKDEKMRLRKL